MAQIVLGVGSSHTPQLSSGPQWWAGHAGRDQANPLLVSPDGTVHTYDELVSLRGNTLEEQLTEDVWEQKFQRGQDAVALLSKRLEESRPDVVVVVGDDQRELFEDDVCPAIGLFLGATLMDQGLVEDRVGRLPPDVLPAQWAAHAEGPDPYSVHQELSLHLAEWLSVAEFDIGVFSKQCAGRTLGHAFTFPRRRLGLPTTVPIVPVIVNTYYPPNVPTPRRCWDLGKALRAGIDSWGGEGRVAFVASGGLTHFVISEEFDRQVLDALRTGNESIIAGLPRLALRSGNSEILNWLVVGGALSDFDFEVVEYIPAYRSPAGTGVGLGFACWNSRTVVP